MATVIKVTNAGRASLVNADNTGTAPVTIAQVGLSATAVTPEATATVLPGEFKRLATLSGDVVADDTIHLIVRDEGTDIFTVRSLALYLADGTLFAIYGQADVLIEKSAQAMMLLPIDVQFEDVDATLLTFGDANFLNPPATTEQIGVVELATLAETIAGLDDRRTPAAKMVKDAVNAWLDARFGANNSGIWHPANDGAGSGLDADVLDGQQGSYYTNITARLGYTPVQQGTGNGQLANTIKIGWSGSRLKATVDAADQGNFVFDGQVSDVWRSSNDGAGSGLDADLLDGQDGSYYTNIVARLGFTPANKAGQIFTGAIGRDENFLADLSSGNPQLLLDHAGGSVSDSLEYDRANNRFLFRVGGAVVLQFGADAVTDPFLRLSNFTGANQDGGSLIGYQKLPGGWVIQYGVLFNVPRRAYTYFNYLAAWPNAARILIPILHDPDQLTAITDQLGSSLISASQGRIAVQSTTASGTITVKWLAIGN